MLNFYISAFLADLALGAVLLSLPLLLIYKFGATSIILGLFGALGSLVYASGVITAGRLSDIINRKKLIIFGCLLFMAVYSVLPFLKHIGHVFLIYILGALSMSVFWPTIQSWLSQGLDKNRLIKALSNFNTCWSGGFMFGFLFAGVLFSFNTRAPFMWAVLLVAVVALFLLRQPVTSERLDEAAHRVFITTENDRPQHAERFLYIAWCANFVSWFVIGIMRNLFPKLATEIGFSSKTIGFFISLMMLAQTAMFFILGRTRRWHYKFFPIILFQALAVIALLILALSSRITHLIYAMVFLGLSSGMTYSSSLFYSLYGFIDKGKRSGIHEVFIGTGALFGPLIGGLVAGTLGIRAPYVAAVFVLFIAIIIESIIKHRKVETFSNAKRKVSQT